MYQVYYSCILLPLGVPAFNVNWGVCVDVPPP